jgi:hypothetical protein
MIKSSCHCGAVSLEIESPPAEITECNCSICRRYGVLWAYYPLAQVRLIPADAPTDIYMWDDRTIEFHRCRTCGCVTHWAPIDPQRNRMGINARLLPPELLSSARVRHLDGANTEQYLD